MSRGFEAIKSVIIDTPLWKVWEALTAPDKIRQYMHGTNISTDWRVGSRITWEGEWKGQAYVDQGTVLEVEPERRLQYTHWSPLGGSEDRPENYHTVTCDLSEDGGTTILTITQDNNPTQADADRMAKDNWGPILEGLKTAAEA